jgi:peptide/nickel transport system permease protein
MSRQQERTNAFIAAQSERRRGTKPKGLLKSITPQSRFYWIRLLLENPAAVAGMLFVVFIIVATVTVPSLVEHDPFRATPANRLQNPSWTHPFGTDSLGRDAMTRAVYGARVSLFVGLAVMLGSALVGSVIGLVAGYYQRIDTPIMRVMDGIMAFPAILLAIAIMASLGAAVGNVIAALAVVYTPIISRLVRGSTLSVKNQPYVEAARSIGASDFTILRKHIFVNSLSPLIVQATFVIAFAIIAEASLSFLGAGVHPETPTWGNMLRDGQRAIHRAWWLAVFPGVLLFLTVLSLNMIGDGLRDALDPRARER